MTISITFKNNTSRLKKTYSLALTEDTELDGCSAQLQALVLAAVELEAEFTLDELVNLAIESHGLSTKQTDVAKIGAWHRPKLLDMKVIKED